ncbi:hypothetical protein MKW98_007224 [Papaver atlanticum]|uniref:Leucine-rich repeat-containing N-terminal plant-type domain-containing protein n=1 Tax=Papaver atlanticum TaxID=357466 RepID=A0AAD4XHL0_9MAGN|nr:hypothetical protein MKW98_007224 [Papaver atlanticum]
MDPSDVAVLQDLYKSLNQPSQLVGWNSMSGANPCKESWKGISCSGSSVVSIQLNGLELHGSLPRNLGDLLNLKQLDLSHNHIEGEIPSSLPPNATHMNLSHNSLSGTLGDVLTGFPSLKNMDMSYNELCGDLPSSFKSLTNLNELYLHHNTFEGALNVLAYLPLQVL